jgi:hypothetical protein
MNAANLLLNSAGAVLKQFERISIRLDIALASLGRVGGVKTDFDSRGVCGGAWQPFDLRIGCFVPKVRFGCVTQRYSNAGYRVGSGVFIVPPAVSGAGCAPCIGDERMFHVKHRISLV